MNITPLMAYPSTPQRCCRCGARVFVYSTETMTMMGEILDQKHYCRTCTAWRADNTEVEQQSL